jgi:tRNA pseudouridine55 synthase
VTANRDEIAAAVAHFQGEIEQIPPMYSALKRDGKPLYEYARAGIEVERAPRKIWIRKIQMMECRDDQVSIEVTCSKGTYIRTLAVDIGERLGCGAHMSALRRTVTGGMSVASAITLDELQSLNDDERAAALLPADALIAYLPLLQLDNEACNRLMHGQAFIVAVDSRDGVLRAPTGDTQDSRVRLYCNDGKFLGLGTLTGDGGCKPLRLVASN